MPRPDYCTHPEQGRTCRGCPDSLNPRLYDGGCVHLLGDDGIRLPWAQADANDGKDGSHGKTH